VRRFALAPVARIREAEARRSSREACRAGEDARAARQRIVALEQRLEAHRGATGEEGPPAGRGRTPGRNRLPRPARGLAEEARSRALLQRAGRALRVEAEEARGVAEVLAGVAARAGEEALLARKRADGIGRAEARWAEARRREREAREEREAEEAWTARSRPGTGR
jgi:hypothetical protein